MIRKFATMIVGCLVLVSPALAEEVVPGAMFRDKMPYRLFVPEKVQAGKKYPLVIFLHGNSSQGNTLDGRDGPWQPSMEPFTESAVQDKEPVFVLWPRCLLHQRWSSVEWKLGAQPQKEITESMQLAMDLVDEVIKNHPIDRGRVYLTGFSMGGYGTWDAITRFPDKFTAAAPIAGGGDPDKVSPALRTMPVRAYHGLDDNTVPTSGSEAMVNAMLKIGAPAEFIGMAGFNHTRPLRHLARDPDYPAWLLSQRRK